MKKILITLTLFLCFLTSFTQTLTEVKNAIISYQKSKTYLFKPIEWSRYKKVLTNFKIFKEVEDISKYEDFEKFILGDSSKTTLKFLNKKSAPFYVEGDLSYGKVLYFGSKKNINYFISGNNDTIFIDRNTIYKYESKQNVLIGVYNITSIDLVYGALSNGGDVKLYHNTYWLIYDVKDKKIIDVVDDYYVIDDFTTDKKLYNNLHYFGDYKYQDSIRILRQDSILMTTKQLEYQDSIANEIIKQQGRITHNENQIYYHYVYNEPLKLNQYDIITGNKQGYWVEDNDKGYYSSGKRDGVWEIYLPKGSLSYKGPYENGKKNGIWYDYDYYGVLRGAAIYRNDIKIFDQEYDNNKTETNSNKKSEVSNNKPVIPLIMLLSTITFVIVKTQLK